MRALIVVDVQNDFLPGGALAVPHGDEVVEKINQLLEDYPLVVATQDWHPGNHGSFASQHTGKHLGEVIELNGLPQVLWPDHCIQGSQGEDFAPDLETHRFDRIFCKGLDIAVDSYSGFFDNGHRNPTGLTEFLRQERVDAVDVVGLATDYCVKYTALDAQSEGFQTRVLLNACRGVELQPGDIAKALAEMRQAGIETVSPG